MNYHDILSLDYTWLWQSTQYLHNCCVGAVDVQITDCGQSVFPINVDTDQMDEVTLNLYNHLCSLLCQRDFYIRVTMLSISITAVLLIICCFKWFSFLSCLVCSKNNSVITPLLCIAEILVEVFRLVRRQCSEISCNVKWNVYLAMEIPDRVSFVSGQIVTK